MWCAGRCITCVVFGKYMSTGVEFICKIVLIGWLEGHFHSKGEKFMSHSNIPALELNTKVLISENLFSLYSVFISSDLNSNRKAFQGFIPNCFPQQVA